MLLPQSEAAARTLPPGRQQAVTGSSQSPGDVQQAQVIGPQRTHCLDERPTNLLMYNLIVFTTFPRPCQGNRGKASLPMNIIRRRTR